VLRLATIVSECFLLSGCIAAPPPPINMEARRTVDLTSPSADVSVVEREDTLRLDAKFDEINDGLIQREACISGLDGVVKRFQSALDHASVLKSYPVFARIEEFSDLLDRKRQTCREIEAEEYFISQLIYFNILTRKIDKVEYYYNYLQKNYPTSMYARDDQLWVRLFLNCRSNRRSLEILGLFELSWRLHDKDRQFDSYMEALEAGCSEISSYIGGKIHIDRNTNI